MATAAKSAYQDADQLVVALLTLEAQYADPPPDIHQASVEALRGSAAVLVVAAFEQYLKDAISEAIDQINLASPPCDFSRLPTDLQAATVYAGLEQAMKGPRHGTSMTRVDRLPGIFAVVANLHVRKLDGSAVAQTGGNPNPETVKQLYKAIGIPDALKLVKVAFDARMGATSSTFIVDTLETVVNRRHAVAHTASALAIGRKDLGTSKAFLNTLVDVLDEALELHMARVLLDAQ